MARILDRINNPKDLKQLTIEELKTLASEIREEIIEVTSRTGGHLASSLGAVELAISIHYVFDTPKDVVLWDVGHQAYAHKLLTGRRDRFKTLRQLGGISGFPNKNESEYDAFTVGHSGTSISSALGLVCARDLKGGDEKIIAVIGDASLGSGIAFEALNQAGHMGKDMMVLLNDNEFSISPSIGALSRYLNRITTSPIYNKIKSDAEKLVKRIPRFGFRAYRAARKLEEGIRNFLTPGMLFAEFGFRYFGPIDGHDINLLVSTLRNISKIKGPVLLHVLTKKGKGYKFAEELPMKFHGIAPFEIKTGNKVAGTKGSSFTEVFGKKIVELGEKDDRVVAVTAAMPDGTGLLDFASRFPARFFDVGIAEQHAVTFGAALARGGFKPIVAIYSTFLQRAYDQIIHDICLQDLGVVLCLDRGGLVGEDGATHHGVLDVVYLRGMPRMVVMAPRDQKELEAMLELSITIKAPVAIRYPRGGLIGRGLLLPPSGVEFGKAEILREGRDLAIFAIGSMVYPSIEAADDLSSKGIKASVINARFVRPLDEGLLEEVLKKTKRIVTVEEGVIDGGFGSAILEFIEREKIKGVSVKRIGLPSEFIEHGKREELLRKYNLTAEGICNTIKTEMFTGHGAYKS